MPLTKLRRRLPYNAHLVDLGRVYCPTVGTDIDVDRCLPCPQLQKIAKRNGQEYLVCRGGSQMQTAGARPPVVCP